MRNKKGVRSDRGKKTKKVREIREEMVEMLFCSLILTHGIQIVAWSKNEESTTAEAKAHFPNICALSNIMILGGL